MGVGIREKTGHALICSRFLSGRIRSSGLPAPYEHQGLVVGSSKLQLTTLTKLSDYDRFFEFVHDLTADKQSRVPVRLKQASSIDKARSVTVGDSDAAKQAAV